MECLKNCPRGLEGKVLSNHEAIDFIIVTKEILYFANGLQVFQLPIAWTRIFPKGDKNRGPVADLQFYDDLLTKCLKYGINFIAYFVSL